MPPDMPPDMPPVMERVCTIDETLQDDGDDDELGRLLKDWSANEVALFTFDCCITMAWWFEGWRKPLDDLTTIVRYIHDDALQGRKHRKVERMDVQASVNAYVETLVEMATGHDHAAFTAAEARTEELMTPLLTAPIDQVREWAAALADRLEQDPRVPFRIWSSFRDVMAPLIARRPQGKDLQLHNALAKEVAELVEPTIPRADLVRAMADALQWRSPEMLHQVKEAVAAGAQPRVRGRQSCLFLQATDPSSGKMLAELIL